MNCASSNKRTKTVFQPTRSQEQFLSQKHRRLEDLPRNLDQVGQLHNSTETLPMTTQVLSAIVPQTQVDAYLDYLRTRAIPAYESAVGLISVSLSRRQVVGYVEFLTLSTWQSEEALRRFLEGRPASTGVKSDGGVIYMEPRAYELVVSREGKFRPTKQQQE